MAKTSAQRQKAYRQRQAVDKIRNEFGVTLMLEECDRAGVDVWPVILECTDIVLANNGNAEQFIRNLVPLVYAVVLQRNLIDKRESPA